VPSPFLWLRRHAWSQLETAIQASAKENDTLVVWIVDRTASMSARRLELADRITKTFGDQPSGSQHKLQHSMISFARGGGASRRQPTTTANDVATQIREIPDDYYGDEFVMGAVNSISFRLMTGWKQAFSDWNCIAVVATDERGDDFNMAEDVATQCVKMNVRVFCLGNASPFGTEKGYVRYKYADGFQVDVPVDQGPETAMLQRLNVPNFWGTSSTRAAQISSGFGPYGLEFLCRKTGGEFLIYEDQSSQRYSKTRLQDYEPDYLGNRQFEKSLQDNRAKLAVCQAALQSRSLTFRINPVVVRGYVVAVLRSEVTDRQKECLPASQAIQKLIATLETGIDDRPTLEGKRWQAAFDLALGQALAASVRLDAMNLFLAQMKVKPKYFDNPHNNTWTMQAAPEVELLRPRLKRQAVNATQLLRQVASEHPGTPFADVAQREIDRGYGWKWVESHREGPALTSKQTVDLLWSFRFGGAPKYLEQPRLIPYPRPKL